MRDQRRPLDAVGTASLLVIGAGAAVLGFALVLDLLSLRALLAQHGPAPLWKLSLLVHARVEHQGAQWVELAAGLIGLGLVAVTVRQVYLSRRAVGVGRRPGSGQTAL